MGCFDCSVQFEECPFSGLQQNPSLQKGLHPAPGHSHPLQGEASKEIHHNYRIRPAFQHGQFSIVFFRLTSWMTRFDDHSHPDQRKVTMRSGVTTIMGWESMEELRPVYDCELVTERSVYEQSDESAPQNWNQDPSKKFQVRCEISDSYHADFPALGLHYN